MNTLTEYDWKKAAAQGAMPDDAVEKAFFDQSSQFIANKAAPIMRDPYRLGFEIVQKNDDNTRMVGIFAFRIAKGLFYAPAFFLNGEIKGTDLFYNHSEKTFKPLTEDWVKYYLEKDKQEQGMGQDRSERKKHPADMQLRRLAMPPFTHTSGLKMASDYTGFPEIKRNEGLQETTPDAILPNINKSLQLPGHPLLPVGPTGSVTTPVVTGGGLTSADPEKAARFVWVAPEFLDVDSGDLSKAASEADPLLATFLNEDWAPILEKMASLEALRPIMKQFLLEDGGWDAFDKIAHAIKHSPDFAERMCAGGDPEDFMPEELAQVVKSASAPEAEIELIVGGLNAFTDQGLTKSAAAEFFQKGYVFLDKRADEKITAVYADASASDENKLESISQPGLYKVLLKNNEQVEAFCAPEASERPLADSGCSNWSVADRSFAGGSYMEGPDHAKTVFVTKDGRTCCARLVFGTMVSTSKDYLDREPDMLKKEMSSGEGYRIYDAKQGVLSDVIYCTGKAEKNGLTIYSVIPGNYEKEQDLKVNPDYDGCSIADGIIGSSGYFVKVDTKLAETSGPECSQRFDYEHCSPGDSDNINQWIQEAGMKKASLMSHEDGCYSFQADGGRPSEHLDLVHMIAALSTEMHIKCAAAEELVLTAQQKGRTSFWMDIPQDKQAGVIRRMAEPRFQTQVDSNFGVDVETPQRFLMPTITEQEQPPAHRIGDAYDPAMGAGEVPERNSEDAAPIEMLMGASPQELAQFSQQDAVPHMFEHGVIGNLVDTYDSSAMIDKYLPDLEQGLDRAGRILFLFYWKPGDFQDLYGTDDMTNLENKLLSNFKSWGDMVLDLLQKTKSKQLGNVPLTGSSA
jgi:hypothetical protein